jgi:hypothetical protein
MDSVAASRINIASELRDFMLVLHHSDEYHKR